MIQAVVAAAIHRATEVVAQNQAVEHWAESSATAIVDVTAGAMAAVKYPAASKHRADLKRLADSRSDQVQHAVLARPAEAGTVAFIMLDTSPFCPSRFPKAWSASPIDRIERKRSFGPS
jgi:hypothetical protein